MRQAAQNTMLKMRMSSSGSSTIHRLTKIIEPARRIRYTLYEPIAGSYLIGNGG